MKGSEMDIDLFCMRTSAEKIPRWNRLEFEMDLPLSLEKSR